MANSVRDPSKHHYIPEFYLRQWAGEDGRFERYTQPIPGKIVVKRVFPSEAGFQLNLYESRGEPERSRYWLETKLFQWIDNRAAPVLTKLNSCSVPELSVEEMSAWSIFIRSLHHRTPARMQDFRRSGQSEWLHALDQAKAEYPRLRDESDPQSFEEYRVLHTPDQVDRLILQVLPSILFSERVGAFMNNMPKRYFDVPAQLPNLVISDGLLAMTNGLRTKNGHYAIPLSPRRLLVAAYEPETLDRASAMPIQTLAANLNRWVVEAARHFVGCTDRSQQRFIRNRFGRQARG